MCNVDEMEMKVGNGDVWSVRSVGIRLWINSMSRKTPVGRSTRLVGTCKFSLLLLRIYQLLSVFLVVKSVFCKFYQSS